MFHKGQGNHFAPIRPCWYQLSAYLQMGIRQGRGALKNQLTKTDKHGHSHFLPTYICLTNYYKSPSFLKTTFHWLLYVPSSYLHISFDWRMTTSLLFLLDDGISKSTRIAQRGGLSRHDSADVHFCPASHHSEWGYMTLYHVMWALLAMCLLDHWGTLWS